MARASLVSHSHGKDLDGPNVREDALGLFDSVPLPSSPTSTQVEAAEKLAPHVGKIRDRVRTSIIYSDRRGATPREVALQIGEDLVSVRARFTELLQAGYVYRTKIRRDGQLVHMCIAAWKPEFGTCPSKRHRGIRGSSTE